MFSDAFIHHLTSLPDYEQQIVYTQHIPAQEARLGKLDKPLNPLLQSRLSSLGIDDLYTHQALAVNNVLAGKNVIVSTASASGKTMCYNVPVLESMLADRTGRALYLFPTKALAQDQLRKLIELACPGIIEPGECATFDGDTPQDERPQIKRKARIVLTNPDMLHIGILPNHESWSKLLGQLKYVVIDEAHVYRGVFGSHVAQVVRRLRRLCRHYGSSPKFILCSATIANPGEHAEKLVGEPFEVIEKDGSSHGGKSFIFWNPPIIDKNKISPPELEQRSHVHLYRTGTEEYPQPGVCPYPEAGRAHLYLYPRPPRQPACRPDQDLPGRLPRRRQAADRTGAFQRQTARCRIYHCPGAGHRYRRPGSHGAHRLSGQHFQHLAAGGTERAERRKIPEYFSSLRIIPWTSIL